MAKTKGEFKLTTDPDEKITFSGPFDKEVKVQLKLTNKDDKKRAFKVKCTNNDLFKIRPAVGKVDGNGSATVTLSLQPKGDDMRKADHHFNVYHIALEGDAQPRKAWADKKEPEGTKTIPVAFKDDDKKEDKKDEKKDEKKDDKKEEKKEEKEDKKEEKEEKKEEKEEKEEEKKDDDKKDEDKKDEEKKDEEKKDDEKKEDGGD